MRPAAVIALLLMTGGAGCGDGSPAVVDAASDEADAIGVDAADPDAAPPPACVVPPADAPPGAVPCLECLVGPPMSASASLCTATICELDASCCGDLWDERCTELADEHCDVRCVNAITFGGFQSQSWGRWNGTGFHAGALVSTPDGYIESIAWADFDGNGVTDLATSGECVVRVRRNGGWSGNLLDLASIYDERPVAGCPDTARFRGSRARWHDFDRDGDLDVAMAGQDGGAYWIRNTAGVFTRERTGTIVPPADGTINELMVADLDADGDVDAVAGFIDGPARWYRRAGDAFTRDPDWEAGAGYVTAIDLCDLAGDRRRELVVSGFGNTRAYSLSDGETTGEVFGAVLVGSTDAACSDLDGAADGKDEIALVSLNLPLMVVDGSGATLWRSDVDLVPPATYQAYGVDAGDLDGDGDVDLVVSGDPSDEPKDIHLFWNNGTETLGFTYQLVPDFLAGHDMRAAEMTYLSEPP